MSYIVVRDQQALVVNVTDPARVCQLVHTARQFDYEGTRLVAVPYGLEETRVLRNMGLDVPSPIAFFYDWPHDKALIPHPEVLQQETSGFLTLFPRSYCLNGIGTGKTITSMWGYDYLRSIGAVRRALVLAPLSSLERSWADTIFFHFKHLQYKVLHGSAAKRKKLFAEPADVYVINHDATDIITHITKDKKGKIVDARFLRDDIDLVIVDELDFYRNWNTERYRIVRRAIRPQMWVWGMTGTPIPQEPSDAWAQCKLITPSTVPGFYTEFRNETMMKLTEHKWVPRANAKDIVYRAMQPSIRYTRNQIFPDLEDPVYQDHDCELSAEQAKSYKEMSSKFYTEVAGGQISAVNEGVKRLKLIQIACGVAYDKLGEHITVDCRPRVKVLLEETARSDNKVIIYAPLEGVLTMLYAELSKHWSTVMIHGQTSKNERDRVFAEFQSQPDPHILLAHPGCMSHSLTLTEASTIIWYAPIDSNGTYTQANGRITRPGQRYVPLVKHIAATNVERRMYRRLKERTSLQGLLLDMVQDRVPF